jgi:hypothetical protein
MELQIEMVPEPIWGMNLRAPDALGKYRWGKLRKSIIAERGPACAICTSPDQPHGHEIWQYEERRRISIATLHGVEITCRACHQIHHWGLTTRLYMQGAIDKQHVKGLIKHFCKINQCKGRDMKQHADEAMVIWQRRSDLRWKVVWGEYREAVMDAKAARVEWEIRMEKAAQSRARAKS